MGGMKDDINHKFILFELVRKEMQSGVQRKSARRCANQ